MKTIGFFLLLAFATSAIADTTLERALAARDAGDGAAALPLWEDLGASGDKNAMIEAALIYHQGRGVPVNYGKAIDWYLKADNGDALNNLGVMFRDGTGVPANQKIAYLAFLTVHMTGMGNEATIMRANRNLRRAISELPVEEKQVALCYTLQYMAAYIKSRGTLVGIPSELQANPAQKHIKDLDWWLEGEVAPYTCPAGT